MICDEAGGGPIRQEHVRECNVEDQMSQSRTPSRLPSEPGPLCMCLIKHLISFSLVFKADMIDNLCTGPKKTLLCLTVLSLTGVMWPKEHQNKVELM